MMEETYIFLQGVSLTVNAGASVGNETFKAFLGFAFLIVGFVLAFIGIVQLSTAKNEWKLYYAPQDDLEKQDSTIDRRKRAYLKGSIILGVGIVLLILSIFF